MLNLSWSRILALSDKAGYLDKNQPVIIVYFLDTMSDTKSDTLR